MDAKEFKRWMDENEVSVQEVTKGTDIHHTTIYRFLQGESVNASTKRALANFKAERERTKAIAG